MLKSEYNKKYYLEHTDDQKERVRVWRNQHRERVNELEKQRYRKKVQMPSPSIQHNTTITITFD